MIDKGFLEQEVIKGLKECFDPEIPVDIYELGLIYQIKIDDEANVHIKMTLTSPGCPVAGTLPGEVKQRIKVIQGIKDVYVELVWNPPWDKDMMTDEAKLILGFY